MPAASAHGRIGVLQASALYVAAVLGTGVLVLPGLAADAAGPGSILAVLILLVLSVPIAGTFAALAARHPDAGGVATYARRALGPTAARAAGYLFLFGVQFGAPVVAALGAGYVVAGFGLDRAAQPWIGLGILAVPLALGWFGLRVSGRVQLVVSAVLVVVIAVVVALAAPFIRSGNFTPILPHGLGGVATAVSLMVWAFAGWEAVTHLAGEFRRPRRTIPLATAIAILVVGAGYLALQVVTVGVLGGSGGSTVPFLDLIAVRAPTVGPPVLAVVAALLVLGVLNVYVPAFSKLAASLGRDGDLPRGLARGAADGEIPRRGLLLTAATSLGLYAVFAFFRLDLSAFILIHTACMVTVYVIGMAAALRLLPRWSLGWWLAAAATLLTIGLLFLAGAHLVIAALLVLAAVIVGIVQRSRRRRRAPIGSSRASI